MLDIQLDSSWQHKLLPSFVQVQLMNAAASHPDEPVASLARSKVIDNTVARIKRIHPHYFRSNT